MIEVWIIEVGHCTQNLTKYRMAGNIGGNYIWRICHFLENWQILICWIWVPPSQCTCGQAGHSSCILVRKVLSAEYLVDLKFYIWHTHLPIKPPNYIPINISGHTATTKGQMSYIPTIQKATLGNYLKTWSTKMSQCQILPTQSKNQVTMYMVNWNNSFLTK